ncbi:hypothetical protein OG500_24485 [Kitasatospora sp. NBC_01250]|uniref:3-oxoacyl-[acyl-carrier-protein] synthase III C-terminal domain-containing protein n=1 Tax=Kitasatospora sp. NBC_01250 TaxID=2903571 RepID=UPI002E2EE956|nr:3-oxoacyl-[acyl-carrier-protein] synthase III C-terminal domain-containing protein [Kitasatospora sp. NBC_01250]
MFDHCSWDFGRSVGHMGGSDVIVSLNHMLESGELAPGDHVLLTSSGPGWTCTATVLTILAKPSWSGRARDSGAGRELRPSSPLRFHPQE